MRNGRFNVSVQFTGNELHKFERQINEFFCTDTHKTVEKGVVKKMAEDYFKPTLSSKKWRQPFNDDLVHLEDTQSKRTHRKRNHVAAKTFREEELH